MLSRSSKYRKHTSVTNPNLNLLIESITSKYTILHKTKKGTVEVEEVTVVGKNSFKKTKTERVRLRLQEASVCALSARKKTLLFLC